MSITVGIGLAFVAMLCWGFGDFLIQKSTRKIGDAETLFVVTAFGAAVLLPFVYKDLLPLLSLPWKSVAVLIAGPVVILIAAVLDFEALREGKLCVVEPLWSIEAIIAAVFAYFFLGEALTTLQTTLIVLLIFSLFLLSFRGGLSRKTLIERGAILAILGALFMGGSNFLIGWGARLSNPLIINFLLNIFIALATGIFLLYHGKVAKTMRDITSNLSVLLPMAITDNAAWVAYAFAMSLTYIGVATALSESYIIITVILGLAVNRERLDIHQKIGLAVAVGAAISLAAIST